MSEVDATTMEVWKAIPGYEGFYEVSNLGRVRSLDRLVATKGGKTRTSPGQIMSPSKAGRYRYVVLCKRGDKSNKLVHRLVLQAFVGPIPPGHFACHNNGRASENRLDNLRYATHLENIHDKWIHGTMISGEKQWKSILTDDRIRQIRELHATKRHSFREIGRMFGVAKTTISNIIRGTHWKHVVTP